MPAIKNYIIEPTPFKLRSQTPLKNFDPDMTLAVVGAGDKRIGSGTGGENQGKGGTVGTGVDTNQWRVDVKAAEDKNNTNGYQGADNLKKEIDESKVPLEDNWWLKARVENATNPAQLARRQRKLANVEKRQKKRADRIYKRNPDLVDPRIAEKQKKFTGMESYAAEADDMDFSVNADTILSDANLPSSTYDPEALEGISNELETQFNLAANTQLEGGFVTPPPSTFSEEEKKKFKNRNNTVISSSDAGDNGESGKFVRAPEIPITGLTSSNELIKTSSNYPASEASNKEPVKPEFGTNEYYIQGFKNFFKKGPQKPNALSDHARLAQEAKAKGMSQFEYANWKRNNSPNKYNSPMKMQGAGINIPSRQSISEDPTITPPGPPQQIPTGPPQQVTGPGQDYTPPAHADINFAEKSEKLGLTGNAKDQYDTHQKYIESLPYFDVAANNIAIRDATTDQWGNKVYGAGHGSKQGRTRGMPPVHIPGSSTGAVTQKTTDYANMGMGGVAPVGVNQAVGMRPTIGSQGYAQRGASPTTSAFAYKQKNSKSPLSFGIFNPTGKDIGGFENQQAANKMAMNTNTYNQPSIPTQAQTTMNDLQMANAPMGEQWKQHSPSFTGTGMGPAVMYKQKNSPLKQLDDKAQKKLMKKEDRAARKQMNQDEKEANPKNQKKKAIQDIRINYKIQKLQSKLNN